MILNLTEEHGLARIDLHYDAFMKRWDCYALVSNSWYRGRGETLQESCDSMIDNYNAGTSLGLEDFTPKIMSKGRIAIEKARKEREKNLPPIEELF